MSWGVAERRRCRATIGPRRKRTRQSTYLDAARHDGLVFQKAPLPLDRLGVKISAFLQLSGLENKRNRSSAVDLLG